MSLKEKLIHEYIDYDLKKHKLTPLRLFIRSIGLDYNKMPRKKLIKWSSTKRYKDFFALHKIKKIADEANIKECIILDNYEIFINNFKLNLDEEFTITESEVLSFIDILEYVANTTPPKPKVVKLKPPKILRYTKHQKRGKYKSKGQRLSALKKTTLSVLGSGGLVSGAEGQVIFSGGKGKHSKRTLGSNRILIKKKVRTPTGMRYHRKVYQTPK